MFSSTFENSSNLLSYMKKCAIAIRDNTDVPEENIKNLAFAHQISFSEATTESVIQLSFSIIIIREFGIPSDWFSRSIHISSLMVSILTIAFEMAKVYLFNFQIQIYNVFYDLFVLAPDIYSTSFNSKIL